MFRYSVLNLSLLPPPPPPAPNLGCGGGETRCKHKSKESPPWVCEKCAKKREEKKKKKNLTPGMTSEATLDLGRDGHGIGCSMHVAAPEDETSEATLDLGCAECEKNKKKLRADETSESTLDLGRDGHSVGCMSRWPGAPDETSEASLDLGCDKCQKGKKRRQAAAAAFQNSMPSGWLNLQGAGMLGQVPLLGSGGRGGKSVPYARNYEEDQDESTLDMGRRAGMLGQVPLLGMGNGGRGGGRAFGYDRERWEDYRYCDPSMEICPLPLVGPVGIGDGGRGGRSVPYNRDLQKCDPRYEYCEGLPYGAYISGSQPKKRCSGVHRYMGQSYSCPVSAAPPDPTLNCQRDARGNTVCSNGLHYPPGCPHTPSEEYFSPGIAPDEVHGGIIEAKIPPPRQAGTTGASGVPAAGAPAGAPGASATSTNIIPLAAGGIAIAGLLYAILR